MAQLAYIFLQWRDTHFLSSLLAQKLIAQHRRQLGAHTAAGAIGKQCLGKGALDQILRCSRIASQGERIQQHGYSAENSECSMDAPPFFYSVNAECAVL